MSNKTTGGIFDWFYTHKVNIWFSLFFCCWGEKSQDKWEQLAQGCSCEMHCSAAAVACSGLMDAEEEERSPGHDDRRRAVQAHMSV